MWQFRKKPKDLNQDVNNKKIVLQLQLSNGTTRETSFETNDEHQTLSKSMDYFLQLRSKIGFVKVGNFEYIDFDDIKKILVLSVGKQD